MTLNLTVSDHEDLKPRITVFGVGGAGGNAVNNMIEKQLEGVEFVVANTDAQALQQSLSQKRIQMGPKVTEGLGAGARPSIGAAAAEETIEEIVDHLAGAHMCFITAGMGGGTGTGAAPIIAQAARELGVLTVGVVTKPFQFEGAKRMRQADAGVEALQKVVDTLIIIPNQNLFRLANERTTFTEAFAMADNVLYQGVKPISDLMVRPGLINLDFADVRSVLDEMGKARMGTGEAEGDDRAVQAAEKAIANPLLDEISLKGAKGVLINITGGYDLTLFELDEAANRIREEVDPEANIIVGSTLDPEMEGSMRVSVVATGIDAAPAAAEAPAPRRAEAPKAEAPKAAAPAFVPPRAEPEDSRTLFDAPSSQPAPEPQARTADDVPGPAYQPQPRPTAAQQREMQVDSDPGDYVAPRAGGFPHPSAESIRRVAEASGRAPEPASAGYRRPAPSQAPVGRAAAPQPAPQERGARFGIASLIGRMSGHGADHAPAAPAPQPARHAAPQPSAADPQDYEDEPGAAQDRIEIPAFLRRQAN